MKLIIRVIIKYSRAVSSINLDIWQSDDSNIGVQPLNWLIIAEKIKLKDVPEGCTFTLFGIEFCRNIQVDQNIDFKHEI